MPGNVQSNLKLIIRSRVQKLLTLTPAGMQRQISLQIWQSASFLIFRRLFRSVRRSRPYTLRPMVTWDSLITLWRCNSWKALDGIGHNACKGSKSDSERKSLLTHQLCSSDTTVADDTYMIILIVPANILSCVKLGLSLMNSCSQFISLTMLTVFPFRFFSVLCKSWMDTVFVWGTGTRPRSPNLIRCSFLLTQGQPWAKASSLWAST